MWLSSFPEPLTEEIVLPFSFSWLLWYKSIDHQCVSFFLDFLICPIDLYVCFHTTIKFISTLITSQSYFVRVCVCVCVV